MSSATQADEEVELPPFPKWRWIVLAAFIWFSFGCVPLILVLVGTHFFSVADSSVAAVAGTIGDAFGLANSFFAAGALLFVIWSIRLQQQEIRFARKEWKENTESQNKQVSMMKEAADLSAINHIYQHYSEEYGEGDATRIKEGVAAGHRMWAIRESFDRIDKAFSKERIEQVEQQFDELVGLLRRYDDIDNGLLGRLHGIDPDVFPIIAMHTASLLVDQRIPDSKRKLLWPLYEILREGNLQTIWGITPRSARFKSIAGELLSHLGETSPATETKGSSKSEQDDA